MKLNHLLAIAILGILFSLASFFFPDASYFFVNILSVPSALRIIFGLIYGVIAGVILVNLNWRIVVLGGVSLMVLTLLGGLFAYQGGSPPFIEAFIMGISIMAFDWVFENIGARLNFWHSKNSILFVKAVPIEVMVGAISGGFGWAMLMPHTFSFPYVLLVSLIVGVGGTLGEDVLLSKGKMKYARGWHWPHAFISYFTVFMLFSFIWYAIL